MQHDKELGERVHQHLMKLGIETPMIKPAKAKYEGLDDEDFSLQETRRARITGHVAAIMDELGLDPRDDSMQDTPTRVAKMYCEEIFSGLDYANFPKCTAVTNKMGYDEIVLERNCAVRSMCEHHLLPIYGRAHVAYICSDTVVGISKLNRVVDFFSCRPQVQERLTEQVSAALRLILNTEDVAVIIEADHFCSKLRGVKDQCCDTVTSKMTGRFRTEPALREELLLLLGRKS